MALPIRYDGCPCAEHGKNGTARHTRIVAYARHSIGSPLLIKYKFRVCANHKKNYVRGGGFILTSINKRRKA